MILAQRVIAIAIGRSDCILIKHDFSVNVGGDKSMKSSLTLSSRRFGTHLKSPLRGFLPYFQQDFLVTGTKEELPFRREIALRAFRKRGSKENN